MNSAYLAKCNLPLAGGVPDCRNVPACVYRYSRTLDKLSINTRSVPVVVIIVIPGCARDNGYLRRERNIDPPCFRRPSALRYCCDRRDE